MTTITATLTPHPDAWINASYGYAAKMLSALAGHVDVLEGWIDPSSPRDVTITFRRPDDATVRALVWDEETGWRAGEYVAGRQGERTVLTDTSYLGGGLLPEPAEVRNRLLGGISEPRHPYRSHADLTDGFDATLMAVGA